MLFKFVLRNNIKDRTFRKYISMLYITGDKAKENYVPLVPFMNFKERLGDSTTLHANISRRGLKIDLITLKKSYDKYYQLMRQKSEVERIREEITNKIKQLDKNADPLLLDQLKTKAITVRNDLKKLKENIYPVENDFIHQFLCLPNNLHDRCPQSFEETLVYRNGLPKPNTSKEESHLNRTDLIHYVDNDQYYLLNEAAEFELDSISLCRDTFVKNGFVSMTNPDFTRKVLMEANLTTENEYHGVHEENQRHHVNSAFLTGGGSFESFLGLFAKLSVYQSVLPLRLVSTGRQYKLCENHASQQGLYSATQANVVHTLVATNSLQEADRQMDDILNLAVDFYKELGLHFRIVFVKASSLSRSESLRASIELYSPAYSRYIEVGSVSHYLDFVSQRILLSTKDKKDTKFLHLVGGPIVKSSVLIAALIENQVPLKTPEETSHSNQVEVFKSLFK